MKTYWRFIIAIALAIPCLVVSFLIFTPHPFLSMLLVLAGFAIFSVPFFQRAFLKEKEEQEEKRRVAQEEWEAFEKSARSYEGRLLTVLHREFLPGVDSWKKPRLYLLVEDLDQKRVEWIVDDYKPCYQRLCTALPGDRLDPVLFERTQVDRFEDYRHWRNVLAFLTFKVLHNS